jgi:Rad3-related DNA helicase
MSINRPENQVLINPRDYVLVHPAGTIFGVQTSGFGMPSKFDQFRLSQAIYVDVSYNSTSRFKIHSMPVGEGKSGAYKAYAAYTGARTCILTSSKGLQRQLDDDFGPAAGGDLVNISGRNNYTCASSSELNCEQGQLNGCRCSVYEKQWELASKSRVVSTNYSYYMSVNRFGRGLGKFDLLVLDEGHSAPDQVCSAMSTTVTLWDSNRMGMASQLPAAADWNGWKAWAVEAVKICSKHIAQLELSLELDRSNKSARKGLAAWNGYLSKSSTILTASEDHLSNRAEWVCEHSSNTFTFTPVDASSYAENILFLGVPEIMILSGTAVPKLAQLLGIPDSGMNFWEYPSSFSPDRNPFWVCAAFPVDSRTSQDNLDILVHRMNNAIRQRLDRKGLIHPVSYSRQKFIANHEDFEHRSILFSPESAGSLHTAVKEFLLASPPALLMNPAMTTGYDFKYAAAQYNLSPKVPFLDGRSPVIKARMDKDPDYGAYVAAQVLAQMHGRIMRARDDSGETLMFDGNFKWFYSKYKHMFVDSFRRTVKFSKGNMLPDPLPLIPWLPPQVNEVPEADADADDDIPF